MILILGLFFNLCMFLPKTDLTIQIGSCACLKALNSKRPQTFHRVAVVDYITNACPDWGPWPCFSGLEKARELWCDNLTTEFFITFFQISTDVLLKKVKHITWQLHNKTWVKTQDANLHNVILDQKKTTLFPRIVSALE